MPGVDIDFALVAAITAWTTAIVAGIRARLPAIDGYWVVLLTAIAALISSFMILATGLPGWVRYALLAWSGAIGGVSVVDRFIKKKGNSGGNQQ
jgi:hypothetical protein